jgi:hypothetical protein
MNQRIIALLLLSALTSHRLQATPLPPHLFNCGLFNSNNFNLSIHKIPKIDFNAPQFAAIRKQSMAFVKNNYGYIASFVALAFGLGWWYERTALRKVSDQLQKAQTIKWTQAGSIMLLNGQLQTAAGKKEELNQLQTYEETWQELQSDQLTQLAFLRTFFNLNAELWPLTARHSKNPVTYIEQACSKKPSRRPHIIYYGDRPLFCTYASVRGRAKTLHLDISYVADPTARNLRVTIIPRYNVTKAPELAKIFVNELNAIEEAVTHAHLNNEIRVKIEVPTLIGPRNFNLHATYALSNFDNDLDDILSLEDHSHERSHSN